MTTSTYSTVINHTTDAGFRAWGSELSTNLQAVGLVKTADTGQINWATVTRPGTSTAAGYEIYRFNDALQGTAPVFLKLEYGTGSTVSNPQLWLTVGTGSDGAGTITGTVVSRTVCATTPAAPSTSTPYPSYVCMAGGQLMVCSKTGAGPSSSNSGMFWHVGRSTDDAGADTADGVVCYYKTAGSINQSAQFRYFAEPATIAATGTSGIGGPYCMVPASLTSSLFGADIQAFKHYAAFPLVRPTVGLVTVLTAEVPAGNTISVAAVGSTPRTYISIGQAGYGMCTAGGSTYCAAMLWE